MTTTFAVDRSDLRRTHWVSSTRAPLGAGQVRLRIDRFALTSNNITYGAFGDAMNYWDFFPTGDATTGGIPVWGFATVLESEADGVAVDARFYGYYPITDEVVLALCAAIGVASSTPRRTALGCTASTTGTCGRARIRSTSRSMKT